MPVSFSLDFEKLAKEIERKFLVDGDAYRELAVNVLDLEQGYLSTDPERTVRIRREYGPCVGSPKMTVKGKSTEDGLERVEIEFAILPSDYSQMLRLCTAIIRKHRYIVPFFYGLNGSLLVCVEVDVFQGAVDGLVLAEIEYTSREDVDVLPTPDWLGVEVTGNVRFYNSNLAKTIG